MVIQLLYVLLQYKINNMDLLATKRSDIFFIDPRNVEFKENLNGRDDYKEDLEKYLELKASIKQIGVQVPISVRKIRGAEKYICISGERRTRASTELIEEGCEIRIPATLFTGSEVDEIYSMVVTNEGVPFNLVEIARSIYRLTKLNQTTKEISKSLGRTPSEISNLLLLHQAPEKLKNMVKSKSISPSLLIKLLREEKDFETAAGIIETTYNALKKETLFETQAPTKITQNDINQSKGITNSYSFLKKSLKQAEKGKLVVRKEKTELYVFLCKLNTGQYTMDELVNELFEIPESE